MVEPIKRQFSYVCCFNSNITELETQLKELDTTRQRVQIVVDDNLRRVRVVGRNVEAWMIKADEITTEVEEIIEDKAKVKEGCLNGWCLNLKLRYLLSKEAVKKTKVVVDLQTAGALYTRSSDSPPPACSEIVLPGDSTEFESQMLTMEETTRKRDFMEFESRRLTMGEIIKALELDEINLIGICGMGGIGKTTMVKEVAKRVKEGGLFVEVAMAVVGKEPNLTNVQACIADMLGLKNLRDTKSPTARADLLRTRLLQDNKKVLVILDDIWPGFDLQAMGIPLEGTDKNFKMLYTSEARDLWHDRYLPTQKEIPLDLLSKDEAWQLFREKADDLADVEDLQPISKKIVNECGRLPLALVLIGSALSGKSERNVIEEIWKGMRTCARSIPADQRLYSCLKLSYEYLEGQEAKRLFLLCCLFKEDEDVRVEDLARYGWGLSLFDRMNQMGKVRRRVWIIVDDLKSRHLLQESEDEEEECIKVHDLVHAMGRSIAANDRGDLISHGSISQWPKTTDERCNAISVISEKIEELPEGLTYPNLEFLMLRCQQLKKLPPNFLEGMGKLSILELHDFGGILTLGSLKSQCLTTLSLAGFSGTLDNASLIGGIQNLQILNLRNSNIEELPEEMGKLVNLRLLDLRDTHSLTRILPGIISHLVLLEELYFWGSHFSFWEGEGKEEEVGNANLREFGSLSNLTTLEICIRSDVLIPNVPTFSKLKIYKFAIANSNDGNDHTSASKFILTAETKRTLVGQAPIPIPLDGKGIDSCSKTSDGPFLGGKRCNDLVQELLGRVGDEIHQLKTLNLSNCDTPEYFANTMNLIHPPTATLTSKNSTAVFPVLHTLYLNSLSNLRGICRGPIPSRSNRIVFPKLEDLKLENLPSLASFCGEIDQIDFPQLKELCLKDIPHVNLLFHNKNKLSSSSERSSNVCFLSLFPQKVSLPNLEVLDVEKLDNLERLGHGPLSMRSLSKLRELSVRLCGKLLSVFPSQFPLMLRKLQELTIEGCHSLEVVFELEGLESNEPDPEILSRLKFVKLLNLPNLNCISKRDSVGFKYIQTLEIHDCNSLRYVFAPTMTKSIPQLHELKISRCKMLSRIVAEENGLGESSVDEVEFSMLGSLELFRLPNLVSFFPNHNLLQPQPLFNEKVAIPSLEYLRLNGLENVSDLWCSELPTNSFSKLKQLKVRDCMSLRNVFHPSMAGGLVNLEKLFISHCSTLEAVIGKEEQVEGFTSVTKIDKTVLPQLGELQLNGLPHLMRFCHFTHPLEMPLLSKLDVLECPNMNAFSLGPASAPNLSLQDKPLKGDLNYAIRLLQENPRMEEVEKEIVEEEEEERERMEEEVFPDVGKVDIGVDEDRRDQQENLRMEEEKKERMEEEVFPDVDKDDIGVDDKRDRQEKQQKENKLRGKRNEMAEPIPACSGVIGKVILAKGGEYLLDATLRQFKYMCCFSGNITELQTQLEELKPARKEVQMGVDEARTNGRLPGPTVLAWLTDANELTTEVEQIIQDKAKVKEGWYPNLKLLYSLSRKAVKKTKSIIELKAAGVPYTQPSNSPPPASLGTIPNVDFIGFESRKLKVEEIIDALKHDEINLIGICGMGGTGKTTMANEVAKRMKEDGLFDEVAVAVVGKLHTNPGQEPDLTDVQDCIADMLGLRDLREQKSSMAKADLLRKRLLQDNKRILVILDDIWAEFDLKAMGIPLEGTNKNFKMLYTSRTRDLWHNLRTRKKEISLGLLSEDEAWQLFREEAGNSADVWDLQPIAKMIVNECGCLPLALVLIGCALSKKSGGNAKEMWENMLDQLIHASRTPTGDVLYSRLELSYKDLEDDGAKKLFLLCCLFGEDEEIHIEDLVRYTFGLSLFDGMNQIGEVRRRVFLTVHDLKSRSLLLDSEREQEEHVKVHGIVRHMGISIASEGKFALVRHGEISHLPKTDINEHYTAMSMISEKIKELPTGLTYPNLEFLMLRCKELQKIPPNFFEGMENLKVLDLHRFRGILTLQSLRNLTTLSLDVFCGTLENVSRIGDLLNLEILSIKSSKIEELPKEIGKLVNLKLLDLSDTWFSIPPGVISSLIHLEELYIWNCRFMNREGEEKEKEEGRYADLRELELLSNLNTLEISIREDVLIPIAPIFSKLTTYKVLIGRDIDDEDSDLIKKCKRVLVVQSSIPIPSSRGGIDSLLRSSDCLVLMGEGCNDLVQDICCRPVPVTLFQEKTYIRVENCGRVEQVIWKKCEEDINAATNRIEFQKLEALKLGKLPNLVCFCKGIDHIDFSQLKTLHLEDIPQLNLLFHNNSNLSFNSERIDNVNLLSLFPQKAIYRDFVRVDDNIAKENPNEVSLPNLEVLEVAKLQNLVRLGDVQLSVRSLSKLKYVTVRNCSKLLSVFPSQLIPMLQELQKLTVEDCHSLEVLIEWEGLESQEPNPEILYALKYIRLANLPKLNSISNGGFVEYNYIQTLEITDCNSLRCVFEPIMMKSIPQLRKLKILRCEMLSRIVADENGLGESSVDEVEFPQLEEMDLQFLPSLVSFFPTVNASITTQAKTTDDHHNLLLPQPLFNEKDPSFEYLVPAALQCMSGRSFSKLKILRVMGCANLRNIPLISFFGDLNSAKESLQEVARILYTNSGDDILALGSNGTITQWRWDFSQHDTSGKATASILPQWRGPADGLAVMKNDGRGVYLKEAVPCMALSKDDRYIYSACGGRVSVFDLRTCGVETRFSSPPPASTFLACHPQYDNVMAIGMEDCTILVCDVAHDMVMLELKGHKERITGLSFSTELNILVSSGADAQLCTWSMDSWSKDRWERKSEKSKSVPFQLPTAEFRESDTRVQFHSDGIHLLVSHEAQLAIYDASKMDCVRQWVPHDVLPAPISSAVYSCDSQFVYTAFRDANIGVFDADSLMLRYLIAPSMYLSPALLSGSQDVYPTIVAAHPKRPNQFAIGLTQGFVILLEPPKAEGKWGLSPTVDNVMLKETTESSSTTSNDATEVEKGGERKRNSIWMRPRRMKRL